MIANFSESRNFTSTSVVNEINVAYFNGTYNSSNDGELSFNISIRDFKTYDSNKAMVDSDYSEFQKKVYDSIVAE